ncbi:MAG: S8 family serine peptidase [Gemmatimonadales bacterium]|jgi:hypothetical protein|nr:S8 family serine peptidase [Gemmatimonadales bacterium]MBP9199949.1 S8 family serine peptidase [Gemmatimonadales bacterium]
MFPMLLALAVCGGCSSEERLQGPGRPPEPPPALARPVVSRLSAPAGSRIAVAVEATPAGGVLLSGLQGELQFDPAALRYVGQAGYDSLRFPLVIVNDRAADAGTLVVLSVDPSGLGPQTATLAFDVLRGDYATSLRYRTDMAVTTALAVLPDGGTSGEVGEDAALRLPTAPVRLGPAQWTRLQRPGALLGRLIDSIPAGRRFGDVTGNGAVDVVDASRVGNWAVGNPSPAGTPIPAPGDLAELVGNVAPFNSPGLGESGDAKGPGWDANCVRLWDVLDAANISNEAVGNDKPVVGELVPADAVDQGSGLPQRGTLCGAGVPPPIPNTLSVPDDSGRTLVGRVDSGIVYFRTMAEVRFQPAAAPSSILAFLTRYRATIIGGSSWTGAYYVRYPDPGADWAAVNTLMALMAAEPGVQSVLPLARTTGIPEVDSRYPDDAPGLRRQNWLGSTSDTTWALRAVRAPQAWGCETGEYGALPVRVGIVEYDFEPSPIDLAPSAATPAFRAATTGPTGADSATASALRYHGMSMAVALSARGNDSTGIPGVIWRTDLRRYALGTANNYASFTISGGLDQALRQASLDRVRVLSLSIKVRTDPDSTIGPGQQSQLVRSLKAFLDSNPAAIILKSTGNDSLNIASGALTTSRGLLALHAALMELALSNAAYADRILFVTGSQPGNVGYSPSNNFAGISSIAAPAYRVALPGSGAALPGSPLAHPVVLLSGTSPAAAMVAGVAAQLLTMDPTLTPAQVKDYILRGAQEPKFDPFTGQFIADSTQLRLPGAPGPVYQLDAYGSLTLLSRERAGVPVCGYEVAVGSQPTWEVKLARKEADTLRIPIPGGEAQGVGVAQGGRRLAVRVFNLATGVSTSVYRHTGALLHTAPGVERQFLERDTADISGTGVTITGPSGSMTYPNVFDLVDGGHLLFAPGRVRVAPDGMHALVESYADDDLGYQCPDGTDALRRVDRVHAVPLGSTGPAIPLLDTDVGLYCPGIDPGEYTGGLYFTWSQDGLRALANRWSHFYNPLDPNGTVTGESSLVREWTVGGMVASHTIAQRGLKYPRYTSDGFAWRFSEFSVIGAAPSCWTTTRQRANPGSPMLEAGAPTGADCFLADFEQTGTPLMPNLRARRNRAGARAARPN